MILANSNQYLCCSKFSPPGHLYKVYYHFQMTVSLLNLSKPICEVLDSQLIVRYILSAHKMTYVFHLLHVIFPLFIFVVVPFVLCTVLTVYS